MSDLADLDTAARLLATGPLLLLAIVVGSSNSRPAIRVTAPLLFAGIIAYLLNASPTLIGPTSPGRHVSQLLAQAVPLLLWAFAHALFERPANRIIAIVSTAATLFTFGLFLAGGPVAVAGNLAQHGLALALVCHALWIAWIGRGDDLVESRRRFRLAFVFAVGAQALVILTVELALGLQPATPGLMLLQSIASLCVVLGLGSVLLAVDTAMLAQLGPETRSDRPNPAAQLSAAETVLRDRLNAAMVAGLWARPGLTVGQLAAELAVPEHRLRALINQRLGHRNFATWLNGHRVGEARRRLADPALVALPVLTIAMDLGFGSLAPFNRAFKEATGMTPTEWRRQALARD